MVSRSPLRLPAGDAVGGGAAAVAAGGDGDGLRRGRRGRQRGQGKNEGGKRGVKAGAAAGQGAAVTSATLSRGGGAHKHTVAGGVPQCRQPRHFAHSARVFRHLKHRGRLARKARLRSRFSAGRATFGGGTRSAPLNSGSAVARRRPPAGTEPGTRDERKP